MYSGPKVKRDGLVFGYDTGQFGSSNLNSGKYSLEKSTRRFNKGKPTTNVVTNTNLDTGWSKGYNTSIQTNDYPPPRGINSQVYSFIDLDGNGSGYWYSYGNYAPQDPSTTYTISLWVRTVGSNFTLRAYTANNSEVGRQYTENITIPGDGKWHRVVFDSITTPSNTQSDSLSFQFTTFPANQRVWICAPQMEVGSIATPFVVGTRSEAGLKDVTKKYTISTSNVSYDSNGFMEFDGTDDSIQLSTNLINDLSTSELTVEAIVYQSAWGTSSASTNWIANWNTWSPGNQKGFILRTFSTQQYPSFWYCWGANYSSIGASSATFNLNEYYHVVGVFKKDSYAKIYVNGKEEGSTTTGTGNNLVYDTSTGTRIGYGTINTGRFNGKLPVTKIYNRALSAAEIKQNFNAYRKRFNLD